MIPEPILLYSAAHAGFPDSAPLGGGKAVADYLIRAWGQTRPFALAVLSPRAVGLSQYGSARETLALQAAPSHTSLEGERPREPFGGQRPLHELTAFQYARFCRAFERRVTERILQHSPGAGVVLSNDISEGPDFATLGARGYRIVTIFHVDVVEYFTTFYLRGWLRPERLTRWRSYRAWPDVLRLVFEKQRDCVAHSARLVVPSAPMKETLLRCYPWCPAAKIVVLPWGNVAESAECRVPGAESQTGNETMPAVGADEFVIMTLSRLSPEKGIERLLKALPLLRGTARVWVCGAPAYMQGRAYARQLHRLAAGLPVEFLGHVTGATKAALLQRADVVVSPSRHESYGLTIAEAQAAGCQIISHGHYGAAGTVVDCGNPRALAQALEELMSRGRTVKPPVAAVKSAAAERLAEVLRGVRLEVAVRQAGPGSSS